MRSRGIRFNLAAFVVLVGISSLFGSVGAWPHSALTSMFAGLYLSDILRAIEQRRRKIEGLKYSEMDEPKI